MNIIIQQKNKVNSANMLQAPIEDTNINKKSLVIFFIDNDHLI